TGGLDKLIGPRKVNEVNVEEVAKDIQKNFSSFAELWDRPFKVDLTGGKDSRVSEAAIISAGDQNVQFRTIANIEGEVDTASELLKIVNREEQHDITEVTEKRLSNRTPIKTRIKTLLHEHDGDYTPVVMKHAINPEKHFKTPNAIF